MIDGGVELDLEAVCQNIAEADVIAIYFPNLDKTLLLDTRCTSEVAPMIAVVPKARDSSERLRSLRRLRPQLPRPESITMIPWARRVGSLVTLGIWAEILDRIPDREIAEACLCELRVVEHREFRNAITGCEYEALWSRSEA